MNNKEQSTPKTNLLVGRLTEVVQYAEQKVRELLGRHPDLVAPVVVDLIAQKEATLASQEYFKRRVDGYENDDYSQQPGLTAYLTPQGRDEAIKMCEHQGYSIAGAQIEEITPNLIALRFPNGIYNTSGGGANFFLEASGGWGECTNTPDKPFFLDYNDVVRIEGDSNELWQNIDYNWDGTPKATEAS